MNSKETCAKHHFLPNRPIEILFAPFERSLSNLQTEIIYFVIALSKKIWGPIEIWSWPPGVLNDPLKKQWIQRKLVRSTIFYQISLLKFCLHHLKDLYQIYRLKWSILWLACPKIFEGPLKFDPDHLACLTTRWKNNEFKGNLCEAPFSTK